MRLCEKLALEGSCIHGTLVGSEEPRETPASSVACPGDEESCSVFSSLIPRSPVADAAGSRVGCTGIGLRALSNWSVNMPEIKFRVLRKEERESSPVSRTLPGFLA